MNAVRPWGDRGAALVEFAFVAPILFLMMFVLADFALAELSDAAGANAAREGARVGILYFDGAHTSGSTNNTKIADAVQAKLANNVKGTTTVAVRCLNADGSARPGGGSCSTVSGDAIDVGEDLIEVSVTWTRKGGITGFIQDPTRTDKAVMRIVGPPPTGSAPPATTCVLPAASASPSTVVRSGTSLPAITFEVTVNDAALCGSPLLDLGAESGYGSAQTMTSSGPTTFSFTMLAGQGSWSSGTKTVTASANGGSVTQDISFTVNDPTVCLITSGTASPSPVTESGGTLSSAVTFTVVVSDAGVCGTPTVTFPGNAGYGGSQTMASAGGNSFTFTLPVGQGTWPAQTYVITANASGGASATISLIVSSASVCTLANLTITPNPAAIKTNGQVGDGFTISVNRSSSTACVAPVVTVSAPSSLTGGQPMSCSGLTCTLVVAKNTGGWGGTPGTRTVTATASGSTVSTPLTLTN